ncbi:MAG: hypothetical protein M3N54_08755 [Acidobacteriota bacterium]|nr:hypothetical protein [Acidobacteriota bacterium]
MNRWAQPGAANGKMADAFGLKAGSMVAMDGRDGRWRWTGLLLVAQLNGGAGPIRPSGPVRRHIRLFGSNL